ncbi:hypothetical protein OPV22_007826 [Ensete ventricosum]|uniref:Uncharacterized protein n=1 Tax=Ensete ventricosum TaxID=4639 RepID=A0AAV8PNE6_ENSVE|nr:hypothetical protein OPV22_007826 [Ensete ventricosum]
MLPQDMRSSSTVAFVLLLLLLLSTAHGIHLERQNHRGSNRKLHEKVVSMTRRGTGAALIRCRESGHCSDTDNVGGADQRIPRIHEDYYGPGDHKSKHH